MAENSKVYSTDLNSLLKC